MTPSPRLTMSSRLTGALWGVIVAGAGAMGIAVYSGYTLDLGLWGIGALAAMGLWLVASALVNGIGSRTHRADASEPSTTQAAHDAADAVGVQAHS